MDTADRLLLGGLSFSSLSAIAIRKLRDCCVMCRMEKARPRNVPARPRPSDSAAQPVAHPMHSSPGLSHVGQNAGELVGTVSVAQRKGDNCAEAAKSGTLKGESTCPSDGMMIPKECDHDEISSKLPLVARSSLPTRPRPSDLMPDLIAGAWPDE